MGKRTPSKWLTLMAACFGLLMLYIDLFIVIVPFFSVFSRLLSRVEQPAGWLWLSRWRGSPRLFRLLPRYTPSVVQLYPLYTCSARRLAVKRCSTSLRGNDTDAATSTSLHVWMDSSVGSPSEQMSDFLLR